jgi:DNA repair exonuclease SbcCD ATPase subunit
MKKLILFLLAIILYAQPATKEDIKELREDIKLLINKVNDIDKKVYANSVKIDMLEKNMNARFAQVDKRFEQVDKRFEQVDKRFEQVDKRFEEMGDRFDDMLNYLWMISTAFLGLTGISIGFAMWDRKTSIKAAKEDIIEDIKTNKLKEFVFELQKLSKEDKELAKVLKSFHLI